MHGVSYTSGYRLRDCSKQLSRAQFHSDGKDTRERRREAGGRKSFSRIKIPAVSEGIIFKSRSLAFPPSSFFAFSLFSFLSLSLSLSFSARVFRSSVFPTGAAQGMRGVQRDAPSFSRVKKELSRGTSRPSRMAS